MMGKTASRGKKLKSRETFYFYTFISPWLIGLFCLTIGPIIYSIYGSFCNWDGVTSPIFVGIKNYLQLLTNDTVFGQATFNTFYYVLLSVPSSIVLSLFLAFMLNKKKFGSGVFQMIFYFPSVCAGIAVYMVWIWLFNNDTGVFNFLLSLFHIKGPNWLGDPVWAMLALVLMNLTFCGGQMLIFLAGLKQIPEQYYEAASLEGVNGLQKFVYITLPMLSPVILFNTLMGMIGAFQLFGQPFILTEGGPIKATYVYGMYIYDTAFRYNTFGYAAAESTTLFFILIVLSLLVMKFSASRVNYDI